MFPSFSNGPYVTSSRRYVTSLPTSRVIRLVRLLLAVGTVTVQICVTHDRPAPGGSPGPGSHLGDPLPMLASTSVF